MASARATCIASALSLALISAPAAYANTNPDLLPPVLKSGSVTYMSGGISREQKFAMERDSSRYPLELHFLAEGPAYALVYVPVTIRDSSGRVVLDASSDGPLMLADLPDGRYTVSAWYKGQEEKLQVDVRHGQQQTLAFDWKY